ncbi:uncharacterized protein LDX57_006895 [Aspergillus melleus]|uniref:uncharacterized protein n=1 Tax=Aspergillus melleus TaxID=138277 RepID=UPI001E8DB712|nr:uncharacterized protein LDX57_006895 [Aspergillus melleus]KAH8429228.1 hypothetical protein LDX57_006895 [Aspergillus melleus]
MSHSPPSQDSVTEEGKGGDAKHTEKVEVVDTVHQDEALKVLENYTGVVTWTPAEEKRLYYDKAMLSQAALFGLRDDLDMIEGSRYSFSASIFYLGFIVGAYPAMTLAQLYPIERVASLITTLWGICLTLTPVCYNYQGLYAQRFFLGLLEAGISPMFMLIVGSWYKKDEQALRMGVWYCWTGYVSIFSPLVNYGLGHIRGTLSPWKYMYLFSGAITILWGIAILFLLPSDPIRAKGFDDRQRFISVARLRVNNSGVRNTHYKKGQVTELLMDVKFWLMFLIAFLSMIANGPISAFTPIIIYSMGFNTLNSLLLMMPAGFYAGTLQLLAPYLAYRYARVGIRSWLVFLDCISDTVLVSSSDMARQPASLTVTGNFVGPMVFEEKDAPRYAPGFIVVIATSIAAGLLVLVYRYLCVWDNRRRDKQGAEGFGNAYQDDLTDMTNPEFRYIL